MEAKYKYILLSNDTGERLELRDAPQGWDATKFRLVRDLTYLGILKTISVEFEFVGDGFEFLQRQRMIYGIDADVLIRVYKRNPNEFLYEGKVNQENFQEDRKFSKYKVDIIQSSFVQNFQNREDVELNLLNTLSLDRLPVSPVGVKLSTIRGKDIQYFSTFEGTTQLASAPDIYHHTLPFLRKGNGNPNVVTSGFYNIYIGDAHGPGDGGWIPPGEDNPLILPESAIYINNLPDPQTITLDFSFLLTLLYKGSTSLTAGDFDLASEIRFVLVDEENVAIENFYFQRVVNDWHTHGSISYVIADSVSVTVGPGQYIVLLNERWIGGSFPRPMNQIDFRTVEEQPLSSLRTEMYYSDMLLSITEVSVISDSVHPVILPHEVFTNLIAQINGGEFYSDFFGRTELGYDVDGEGAFLSITKGELLRGIPLDEVQIPMSFRDAFSSYASVFCLGAIISENRIQVEPLDALFNAQVAAELGEVSELMISPTKEFLFNSVKTGYPKNEYEEENGRDEFNTEYQYSNSLRAVKKELNLVSKFYGDGYGIEFARRQSVIVTGTKDSKYDDKIFFVDLIKVEPEVEGESYTLISRRLEGITYVTGIFSPETALNLSIAVGQNMLRWRKYLNIPLHKKNKVYYFQSKDKNAGLNLVTPLGTTIDGQDLDTGNQVFFLPEFHSFNSPITLEILFAILANPLGMISFTYDGEKFFDHVFEIDAENDKGVAECKMLGTKDTPIQVEDEIASGPFIKYADGLTDYVEYADGGEDYILYQ